MPSLPSNLREPHCWHNEVSSGWDHPQEPSQTIALTVFSLCLWVFAYAVPSARASFPCSEPLWFPQAHLLLSPRAVGPSAGLM